MLRSLTRLLWLWLVRINAKESPDMVTAQKEGGPGYI
jgi:hypothetical protein